MGGDSDNSADSAPRLLQLDIGDEEADPERLDAMTSQLLHELLRLDNVDDVRRPQAGRPPPGSRGVDAAAVGGLVVLLGQSVVSLKAVVSAVRSWLLGAGGAQRTVKFSIDGDSLEISAATISQQQQIIEEFLNRHSAAGGERWMASEKH